MNAAARLIHILRPGAQLSHTPALGCYTLGADGAVATWQCGGTPPTTEELAQAQARLDATAELAELHTMLDERYALFARALARQDAGAQAELQEEIQSLLTYIQEVQHAARPA